jgi:hypothetical protein
MDNMILSGSLVDVELSPYIIETIVFGQSKGQCDQEERAELNHLLLYGET